MGDNKLRPIVGKSTVLEERRYMEEKALRQQRRIAREKQKRKQKIKAVSTLIMLLLVIAIGMSAIIKMVFSTEEKEIDNKSNNVDKVVSEEVNLGLINIDESYYKYQCEDLEILDRLKVMASTNDTIKFIYDNYRAYPEDLLKGLSNNSELTGFALKYPIEIEKEHKSISSVEGLYSKGEVPLFIQWDDRWGYYSYGEDVLGISGCGPTCLSMVIVGLTGKNQYTPTALADFAMDNGYYYNGAGTTWDLFNQGVKKLGLKSRTLGLSEASMVDAINNGEYLILSMGPGIFTLGGHYIVIYGYEDGRFIIKDPNSVERSGTTYSFDQIKDQIKNIWAIS